MYIEVVPNRSSPPAVLLRQSYREDGKVKKITLGNFSKLPDEHVNVLRRSLRGERPAATERRDLTKLTSTGKAAAHRITRARLLLLADEGSEGPAWIDEDVAEALGVTVRTVENIRKRFVNEGLEAAINRKKRIRPPRERLLDGQKEACHGALQNRPVMCASKPASVS